MADSDFVRSGFQQSVFRERPYTPPEPVGTAFFWIVLAATATAFLAFNIYSDRLAARDASLAPADVQLDAYRTADGLLDPGQVLATQPERIEAAAGSTR
jgi:hypothetical protein